MVKAYPKYKDSGAPWLGRVPENWDVLPTRTLFSEVKDRGHIDEELLSVTISQGVIRQEDLISNTSKKDSSNEDKSKYKLVEPGDIAYNKMRAWQGAIGISQYRGIVSPAYIIVRPRRKLNARYFHYLLRTPAFAKEAERWSYGITSDQWSLRSEHFKMIYCSVPSDQEQEAIVRFLDGVEVRVRSYIRAKQQVIKLLNEQKQAIINKVMARGLNPAVHLKPSGVDWIGEIPSHWKLRKLKFIVNNINEQASLKRDNEVYIALDQIESWTGKINFPDGEILFESQVKRFRAGDILFCKLRPYLAKVTRPDQDGVCVGELLVLRLKRTDLLPEFIEQRLRSSQVINIVNSSTFGAKMPRADWFFIGNLMMAYPESTQEQRELIDYIESNTRQLTFAIRQIHEEIKFLNEYRTRLVSDVVTGKIDVRDVKLPDLGGEDLREPIDEQAVPEDIEDSEEVVNADE